MSRKREYIRIKLDNVADLVAQCLVRGEFNTLRSIDKIVSLSLLDPFVVYTELERYSDWYYSKSVTGDSLYGLMKVFYNYGGKRL